MSTWLLFMCLHLVKGTQAGNRCPYCYILVCFMPKHTMMFLCPVYFLNPKSILSCKLSQVGDFIILSSWNFFKLLSNLLIDYNTGPTSWNFSWSIFFCTICSAFCIYVIIAELFFQCNSLIRWTQCCLFFQFKF